MQLTYLIILLVDPFVNSYLLASNFDLVFGLPADSREMCNLQSSYHGNGKFISLIYFWLGSVFFLYVTACRIHALNDFSKSALTLVNLSTNFSLQQSRRRQA